MKLWKFYDVILYHRVQLDTLQPEVNRSFKSSNEVCDFSLNSILFPITVYSSLFPLPQSHIKVVFDLGKQITVAGSGLRYQDPEKSLMENDPISKI